MSGFDGLPDLVVWFWILIWVCWFLGGLWVFGLGCDCVGIWFGFASGFAGFVCLLACCVVGLFVCLVFAACGVFWVFCGVLWVVGCVVLLLVLLVLIGCVRLLAVYVDLLIFVILLVWFGVGCWCRWWCVLSLYRLVGFFGCVGLVGFGYL